MNFDKLESSFGGISVYQIVVIGVTGGIILGTASMSQSAIFLSAAPAHRCSISLMDDSNAPINSTEENIALFIPVGDSCHRYAFNLTRCNAKEDLSCVSNSTEAVVTSCDNGYIYNRTYFSSTTVSEWDLVCGRTSLDALANSMYFVGVFFGSFLVGAMLDWLGRKKSILVIVLLYMATGFACAFARSYPVYIALRVAVAMFGIPCFVAYFTYAAEISGKGHIVLVSGYTQVLCGIAHTVLPGIAYFVRDWRVLCIIISLIPVYYCVAYFFLPESPRWLLTKKREVEAKEIMMRFAKGRGVEFLEETWQSVVETEKKITGSSNSEKVLLSHLFRGRMMRMVSLVVIYLWFVVSMVFYGLTLNVGKLTGDPYVNRVLNGVVEILACCMYMISTYYMGRRISTALSYGLAGLCCILTMLLTEFSGSNQAMLECGRWFAIGGKFFCTTAFATIYQYTTELYPTTARGTGMGLGSMSARVGSIIMPWTLELQSSIPWLTQAIFGVLSLLGGAASLLLPETKGAAFTTALDEAEKFNRKNMPLARRLFYRSFDADDGKKPGFEIPLVDLLNGDAIVQREILVASR